MTTATTDLYDATHANIGHLPTNSHVAGYVTGSGDVPWTTADWAAHPGAVRIAQSPILSVDESPRPDFIDFEAMAVTLAEVAPLIKAEQAAFTRGERPGQRWPGVYCSRSVVHEVANALIAGGVTSCPLGIADYNTNIAAGKAEAVAEVAAESGPFPVVWRQYSDQGGGGAYDLGIVSVAWLANVSKAPVVPVKPTVPPGQWLDPSTWTWRSVSIVGAGLDGLNHQFNYNTATGEWVKVK